MAEAEPNSGPAPKRRSRGPVLAGLVLACLAGGGGFYAAYSGLVAGGEAPASGDADLAPLPEVGFVPIAPLVISLGPGSNSRHLRFTGELEVPLNSVEEVTRMMPRVLDVLNSYLRAVDARQFEDPGVLLRLRAQMLRRVQLVVGDGRVRDILVTEFVLN